MRILILGGDGMLGHELMRRLAGRYDAKATLRQDMSAYDGLPELGPHNCYAGVDVRVTDHLMAVLAKFHPDVVLNSVGIVKQREDGLDTIPNLEINALLPHRLTQLCRAVGARLIHISTDCVFSGRRGMYSESDPPDPIDVYGHSKLLGEVEASGAMTLRTSIIGLELKRKAGLVEWFLRQKGSIRGFRNAIFSGLTTMELARLIERLLVDFPEASGRYHVASKAISKYELLVGLRDRIGLEIRIDPDDEFRCDRSLDGNRFNRDFGYTPPAWNLMLDELAQAIRERMK